MSNKHPISNNYNFKDSIYNHSFSVLIGRFLLIFFFLSFIFFFIYLYILKDSDIDTYKIFRFSLFQSFGYNINDIITTNLSEYELTSFIQKTLFVIINLIFTSSIIFKYFNKPDFFEFKSKLNFVDNKLSISFYNKTNFDITSCNVKVYARMPYLGESGNKGIENIELFPENTFFPFMDKHLVTRLNIYLDKDKNNRHEEKDERKKELIKGLIKILNNKSTEYHKIDIKYVQISVIIEARSSQMDSYIYEIKTYKIEKDNIKENITLAPYKFIDLNLSDYSKSNGWDTFEDKNEEEEEK